MPSRPPLEVAHGAEERDAAAVHRHSHQAVSAKSCATARCARSRSSSTDAAEATRGQLPPNFVVTLPKVIDRRARHAAGADSVAVLERRQRLGAGHAADGADDRDAAVDLRRARRRQLCPRSSHAARRTLRRPRTSGRTTTRRRSASRPRTSTCGIRSCDFAHGHDAGRVRRHRRLALGRRDQRDAGAGPSRAERRAAHARRRSRDNRAAVHRAWKLHYDDIRHSLTQRLLSGLGSASGAAADALRRGLRVLSREPRRRRRSGCATSSRRRRRRRSSATCSTMRRPVRGC